MKTTKTTRTTETTTTTTLDISDSDSDSTLSEGLVVVPVMVPVPVVVETGGEARRQVESMKTEMNEMRVRTAQLQNHAMEEMQEAEDMKKKKFMNEAMIKKTVGSLVTLVTVVGVILGVKFGLF